MQAQTPSHWLLLRGLVREAGHWGDFPARLRQATGARVSCLDLPGTGSEHERPSPLSIAAMVHDVRARFVRPAEPVGVLGISMGGMVALDWCKRYPGDFSRCVVINTSARNLGWPHERLRLGALPRLLRAVVTRDVALRERLVLAMTSRRGPQPELVVEWEALARAQPVSRRVLLAQLVAAASFVAPGHLSVPLLVLAARGDALVQARCSEVLAQRLNASLAVHDTAGHDLPRDDPEWVVAKVLTWARVGETSGTSLATTTVNGGCA